MPRHQRSIGSQGRAMPYRTVATNGGEVSNMSALLISLLVFALIFGGALVGMFVRPLLSESHLHPDSKDVVKLATGLIGTLASTALWPSIATTKTTFDQKTHQARSTTTTILSPADLLAPSGPEAS